MRIEFVECKSRTTAKNRCPWASKIMKYGDGYKCFESAQDYYLWKYRK